MIEKFDHPVQFKKTMWELLIVAAAKESLKKKETITPAEYVRRIVSRNLKRKEKEK